MFNAAANPPQCSAEAVNIRQKGPVSMLSKDHRDLLNHHDDDAVLLKEQKLEDIKNQCSQLISELDTDKDPKAIIRKHITKLKDYNDLQDIALSLVTMIADHHHLRTIDILQEMNSESTGEMNREPTGD
ncbi:hypothetical protein CANTEDRAFT_95893 [Yamadazyma tenuis ATCC 10573]|uniref:Swi5-domain-containing protein n=1 Tax=Candida tenuis (strain ATCC 10573 / BCRC 21748 / CBS 615 / JCM 9827 / NBRC 10315 / NRRL Y-1498 / VKM Y-70) TaxID=590646 RepID=G3BE31_CANTC|nr:uncharacterized protein CANTEDRAFT_95893 [Yamadazyma tenuis ATCC 10573]EGV60446.1 hypothetical protein CANTEDRAFT_95893 [Yamadazyma tenuis ATCC 10573]